MRKPKELNDIVSLQNQLQTNENGSVFLINVFTIDTKDEETLLVAWSHDASFMKEPDYISTQMYKAICGSATYINYAIWEVVESFRNAFNNPEFQKRIGQYPDSANVSTHLFKKLAVNGHCVE
ncbi:MAG TPA: antibiotic biosynthesis monooxygenase [Candidatus Megaira endosymbiont of Nemacystus decipiens]|nr:antibiotic biosynthesis monooxygenase [Candidatus Megaera endosymbiont of Nemacystus decipiens]